MKESQSAINETIGVLDRTFETGYPRRRHIYIKFRRLLPKDSKERPLKQLFKCHFDP